MGTSADAPYCDVIYKLNEITDTNGDFLPTMKLSEGKVTYPGRKQTYRVTHKNGIYKKDIIGLEDEEVEGAPLLTKIMEKGKVIYQEPTLKEIRDFTAENLTRLPPAVTRLARHAVYPVSISPKLKGLIHRVSKNIREKIKE